MKKIGSDHGLEARRTRENELHPQYAGAWDKSAATFKQLVANSNEAVDKFASIDAQLEALLHRPFLSSHRGTMLRSPYGGVENVQEMKDVGGMEYLALNIGDYDSAEWNVVRSRAAAAGIPSIPKGRVYTELKVRQLVTVARTWGSSAIVVNLETEAKSYMPPSRVRELLDEEGWDGEVGVSTECHLYDYPAVSWVPLTGPKYTALLQVYPEDGRVPPESVSAWQSHNVRHARASGFTYVGVTYQCWRSSPDWFDRTGTYSLAYADDVPGTGGWAAWAPQ